MPTSVQQKVALLTDQQALSIVGSLAGEFAEADTPEGYEAQMQALKALFEKEGQAPDLESAAGSKTPAAANAARQLLLLIAELPEAGSSLEQWLDDPPVQEAAAIPLVLAAPVVLTGCVALLQVAGHVRFTLNSSGSWEVDYDPSRKTPLDTTLKELVGKLADLMGALAKL